MGALIACVGRRRLEVSVKDGQVLLRIMILDDRNVLANLVLEPADADRLAEALIDASPLPRRGIRREKKAR